MRSIFYLLVLTIIANALPSFSQNETNIWYFGNAAGVDFNSGTPVSINNGNTYTVEGTAVMCDANGSLLFYTDGITVWNANNNPMPNGFGLGGGISSSQSALILQQPGSTDIYYIFTTAEAVGPAGLSYSIVDMTQASGLGDVISLNNFLHYPMGEKVTCAKHSNGTDFWILSHEMFSNEYYAYLFNASGVDPIPVVTAVGSSWNSEIGCMKASPDGSKVAASIQYMDNIEVADFDNSTGIFSNPITWPSTYNWTYGVEFSPDSKILYFDKYGGGSQLYQVDLLAGSATDIINSTTLIAVPNTGFCGSLQLGPDGKIYLAQYGLNAIGAINDPNVLGTGCNYVDNVVMLSGNCQLGLPNYSPTFFNQNPAPQSTISASDTSVCEKFCIDFFDLTLNNPTSWLWEFPGGIPSSSTDQNPVNICYDNPGTYDVTLITSNTFGTDTLTLSNFITIHPTPPFPTIIQNDYTLTSSPAASYQWQFNSVDIAGATNQSYTASQTGYYTVIIHDSNGCQNSATIYVEITGVEDEWPEGSLSVYPNPSEGIITIEWATTFIGEAFHVKIFNTLGQQVYFSSGIFSNQNWKQEINLKGFAPGVYVIQSAIGGKFIHHKLIIEK